MNNTITTLKSAIIGKIWLNGSKEIRPATFTVPTDMTFEPNQSYMLGDMSFRTDRNLIKPIEVKANERLFLFPNNKRNGINDPDFSVSIKRPEAEANEIIENSKKKAQEWKDANQPEEK
jgi:hypothetical protein